VIHELVDERIGVIRLIGNDRARVGMFEQWFSASKIVILPRLASRRTDCPTAFQRQTARVDRAHILF
jgi:hypothetical protein